MIKLDRCAQRPCHRLEASLNNMVVVGTVEIFNMERNARRSRETVELMFEQFRVHLTQARGRQGRLEHEIGPTRNITRSPSHPLTHLTIHTPTTPYTHIRTAGRREGVSAYV